MEKMTCESQARRALKAAAPYMLADAKSAGWKECVEKAAEVGCLHELDAPELHAVNPYGSTNNTGTRGRNE